MEAYKNRELPLNERINDLIPRMTLKEKVGQLNQKMFGWNAYIKKEKGYELTEEFKDQVAWGEGMGALYGLFRADPWSKVTFKNGIDSKDSAKVANMVQRYVIENTRLGIPILLSEECPHGHQALDGTVLPTNIGMGSTWNPVLCEEAYAYVAAEIRARGGNLGLVSVLDILREPRWGRSEECFGEDPYHASKFSEAVVRGLQGKCIDELKQSDKVGAVIKHFCAQSACVGGHNQGAASIGERELREIFYPAAKTAIDAKAVSIMAAYNEIDGVPCHANEKLLKNVLREELGFEGMVMADGTAIDRLIRLTGNYELAGILALTSGIDISLWDTAFTTLKSAVEKGKISEALIDVAVSRVLRTKFLLGLFEQPYTDENLAASVLRSNNISTVNLHIARESVVLLKNDNATLPLCKNLKKIAVIGPNADNIYNQLGDYTAPQRDGTGITVLEGIRMMAEKSVEVAYTRGCGIRDTSREGFAEAINLAKNSDAVVMVLGGSSTRNFDALFDTTGAAIVSDIPGDMDCGEGVDTADLELGGVQVELLMEIAKLCVPVTVVLIQGRPHAIPGIVQNCNAIVCGWYPGKEGGQAIAEILFGKVNPSGKLPVSIPKSSAQLPVYYNYKDAPDYADMSSAPLYPFGYGLSYTEFFYSNMCLSHKDISVEQLYKGDLICVSIEVQNIGSVAGAEVVQLYIRDMESCITRRVKELKGFEKIRLSPGEIQKVEFTLSKEELGVWDRNMGYSVEPGKFLVYIEGSNHSKCETAMNVVE